MAKTQTAPQIDLASLLTFDVVKGLTIPEQKRPDRVEHPFVKKFGEMEHNDAFFLPIAYFTLPKDQGGRGIDTAKTTVDHAYAKDKIRGVFKAWKDKDKARENRKLILVNRNAGDDAGNGQKFPVEGVSVFMQIVEEGK